MADSSSAERGRKVGKVCRASNTSATASASSPTVFGDASSKPITARVSGARLVVD